ncbi:hypothetical protein GGTG_13848 [Gaeumannomyces tritici R3-111a-1]|uniref:Uncharacterized protein n=1 Tax=Gaeumannomyces tritici (strain R3-111a-1) TaxID=644352 RepID=J3PK03_GAET3|nr:hypothetical protein GGTG_13848 [Gaeumannomyces tritici R3-111a-1]EJT68586.1 hypothetical protein GGTG_13848 [Gaeumannomyces tritici R3-111a-1]
MSSPSGIPVLVMGLKSGGSFSEEDIKKATAAQARLAVEAGFAPVPCILDPAADDAANVATVREQIKKTPFKIVAIGGGVRGDLARTPLFEQLVNICIEEIKPTPRLVFPSSPDDAVAALKRGFA